MAFKFRAASGDLSGSPSAREGPAPTMQTAPSLACTRGLGRGTRRALCARGTRLRRDLHGFQDLAELDAQYYAIRPTHANGTQGPQGDQITSIEASFVFHWHSLKTRKLSIRPHHREVHRVAAKVTPPPARPRDVQKDTLRDPAQRAGNLNSKIKFGVHQRLAESAPLIAGASKAVPLLYLHVLVRAVMEKRDGHGHGLILVPAPSRTPGPQSSTNSPPPLLGYCGSAGRLT